MERFIATIISRLEKLAEENALCEEFWHKATRLKETYLRDVKRSEKAIWSFFMDNTKYIFAKKVVTFEEMEGWFGKEKLMEVGIYIDQESIRLYNKTAVLYNSSGTITGHSKVELFGRSNCRAFDTSYVTCYDDSHLSARDCHVIAFDRSDINIGGYGYLEAYDDSTVSVTGHCMFLKHDNVKDQITSQVFKLER